MALPILAVSADEIVSALRGAGFRVELHEERRTTLVRGIRRVIVPRLGTIGPDSLLQLLHAAGITYGQFIDLLEDAQPAAPATHVRRKTLPG